MFNTTTITNFIYELGSARRIKRSHKQFIGTSDESVSDHTFRTVFIAYILASMEKDVDTNKVVLMALIHDLPEIRTGDMNPINKIYNIVDEKKAFLNQIIGLPVQKDLQSLFEEYHNRKSKESIIVKDADILEQISLQQEYAERGVNKLREWNDYQVKLLKLETSKNIAEKLISTSSFDWLHNITLNNNHVSKNSSH